MGIRHAKAYTLRGRSLTKLGQSKDVGESGNDGQGCSNVGGSATLRVSSSMDMGGSATPGSSTWTRKQNAESKKTIPYCLVHDDLNLNGGVGLIVISDSHKLLPQLRHILKHMKYIREINPESYEYLVQKNPNSWYKAFFSLEVKCLAFKNRICESYHKAIIVQRSKPIVILLEYIRIYLMQRLVVMSKNAMEKDLVPKTPFENNSQVSRSRRRMTCISCLEVGHNKTTYNKDPVPKTPKPRKPPGRKSQTESVSYASSMGGGRGSRGRGGGRGRRDAHASRGGSGRGRVGLQPQQEVEEDELRNALDDEYIEHLLIDEEEKSLAMEKEILERQDKEFLQQAMEEERDYQRQDEEKERYEEQQRQWDFDHDYLNLKNFIISKDEMDVDEINKNPTSNNLNLNAQESVAVHI
ncbi:hypothetical protein Tco_0970602 [Tanacetum coccineum]